MTRDPLPVLNALVRYAPPLIAANARLRSRCILATRVGVNVLEKFGLVAVPLPVSVHLANKAWMDWRAEYPTSDAWAHEVSRYALPDLLTERDRRGAWMLSVGQTIDAPGDGWNGHLVLHLPTLGQAVDLDAQQFARPTKQIRVPDAWVFPWPDVTRGVQATNTDGCLIEYNHEPTNVGYRVAPDWTRSVPTLVGLIAAKIRADIKKGTHARV